MTIQPTRGDVFAEERQQHIARIVEEHGRARVAELSRLFGVSGVTIRKDLDLLEQQGRLVRTHGGAVVAGRTGAERAFDIRERLQRPEKDAIGRAAAAMVVDGESIALDASTTALAMARHLAARGGWLHLTVITNGLRIAAELAGHPGISVAMPAGFVRWEALSLVGPLSEGLFDRVNIQRAFMGAAGFSLEAGLTDATEEEAQIKRLFVTDGHRGRRSRRPHEVGACRVRDVLPDGVAGRGRGGCGRPGADCRRPQEPRDRRAPRRCRRRVVADDRPQGGDGDHADPS